VGENEDRFLSFERNPILGILSKERPAVRPVQKPTCQYVEKGFIRRIGRTIHLINSG
jgi:hypothetical protein